MMRAASKALRRLAWVAALLATATVGASPHSALSAGGTTPIDAEIRVTQDAPYRFIEGPAGWFFPGDRLSFEISRTIDLNPETVPGRRCKILGRWGCKDTSWVRHNERTPTQHPPEISFRQADGSTGGSETAINGLVSVTVPTGAGGQGAPLAIVGWIPNKDVAGNVTLVNRRSSTGWYRVRVTVDASPRIAIMRDWLRSGGPMPSATAVRAALVNPSSHLALQKPAETAALLIDYSRRIDAEGAAHADRAEVLKLAAELDPTNPEVPTAFAEYHRASGNAIAARQSSYDAVVLSRGALKQNNTPTNQLALARAIYNLAKNIRADTKGMLPSDAEEVVTLYAEARSLFAAWRASPNAEHDSVAVDLQNAVEQDYAFAARALRTPPALRAAAEALETHLRRGDYGRVPRVDSLPGVPLHVSADHAFLLLGEVENRLMLVQGDHVAEGRMLAPSSRADVDITVHGQDRTDGHVLAVIDRRILWVPLDGTDVQQSAALPPELEPSQVISVIADEGITLVRGWVDDRHRFWVAEASRALEPIPFDDDAIVLSCDLAGRAKLVACITERSDPEYRPVKALETWMVPSLTRTAASITLSDTFRFYYDNLSVSIVSDGSQIAVLGVRDTRNRDVNDTPTLSVYNRSRDSIELAWPEFLLNIPDLYMGSQGVPVRASISPNGDRIALTLGQHLQVLSMRDGRLIAAAEVPVEQLNSESIETRWLGPDRLAALVGARERNFTLDIERGTTERGLAWGNIVVPESSGPELATGMSRRRFNLSVVDLAALERDSTAEVKPVHRVEVTGSVMLAGNPFFSDQMVRLHYPRLLSGGNVLYLYDRDQYGGKVVFMDLANGSHMELPYQDLFAKTKSFSYGTGPDLEIHEGLEPGRWYAIRRPIEEILRYDELTLTDSWPVPPVPDATVQAFSDLRTRASEEDPRVLDHELHVVWTTWRAEGSAVEGTNTMLLAPRPLRDLPVSRGVPTLGEPYATLRGSIRDYLKGLASRPEISINPETATTEFRADRRLGKDTELHIVRFDNWPPKLTSIVARSDMRISTLDPFYLQTSAFAIAANVTEDRRQYLAGVRDVRTLNFLGSLPASIRAPIATGPGHYEIGVLFRQEFNDLQVGQFELSHGPGIVSFEVTESTVGSSSSIAVEGWRGALRTLDPAFLAAAGGEDNALLPLLVGSSSGRLYSDGARTIREVSFGSECPANLPALTLADAFPYLATERLVVAARPDNTTRIARLSQGVCEGLP